MKHDYMRDFEHTYLTLYGYKVPDGGAHADTPVTIGKLMIANFNLGLQGPRVYSRREPAGTALFHMEGCFSIDARAQKRWETDDVEVIQFIDKTTEVSALILRRSWVRLARLSQHGAGWQAYVDKDDFEYYDRPVYDDSHYNPEVRWLDPLPRTRWVNLAVPQPPVPQPGPQLRMDV